jgi:Uma2 family endonuclease
MDDRTTDTAMNVAWTRAAEGLPRRAFTVADVRRMIDIGVIGEDERIELLEGELVVMAAKGYAHEIVKTALVKALVLAAKPGVKVGVEMSIQFAPEILLEPDIAILAEGAIRESATGYVDVVRGGCLLIVEVAQSSLGYDKETKASLYAGFGVREFWVIDANERTAWVHTGPTSDGWSQIAECGPDDVLITPVLPNLSIKLSKIE